MRKKRYAQVGVGGRSCMFTRAITEVFADRSLLVGLCDNNPGRLALRTSELPEGYPGVHTYSAEDFDRMIAEQKPDVVVVTTPDCYHHRYICRAMELGCDVVTEKPMTIDAEKCRRIVDTMKRTGRKVRVTFNYRYSPPRSQVKELLMEGVVGRVLSVDFSWMLDTTHGADYYRRWHRWKKNSGGLIVHKATHHFDLVNWWISSTPVEVFAHGKRDFYGPEMARRYGLEGHGERCLDCQVSGKCKFYLDLAAGEVMKATYLDQEKYDGYFRDRCVFSGDIDIWDTMSLSVRYSRGALMNYTLCAYAPWEGYYLSFTGSKGRLEHNSSQFGYVSGRDDNHGKMVDEGTTIVLQPHFAPVAEWESFEPPTAEGGHGGGDPILLADIFDPDPPADPLGRKASQRDGAYSILVGVAAYRSIDSGLPVKIADLIGDAPLGD